MKWLNKKLGTRYWYSIRFIYKKNGVNVFDWQSDYGFLRKSDVLNSRYCKKAILPLHKQPKAIPKRFLNNGVLCTEVVCYLGWFKQTLNKTTLK